MANSLQEVLNRANTNKLIKKPEPIVEEVPKKKKTIEKTSIERSKKENRSNTVLIGGHFPPEVSRQLRIIAAEEGTTNQALLQEALDLLFAKKGKKLINDI
ncbi:hypothetical protein SAMN05216302_10705 [Nitrosomonas aestuarii]|uniref:Antitoxin-like ribbon-helix-helix domain-containing protein n=1 Tax=Nitrosomonas aestuarii TaxID=52441 RepID=A0A1I4H412_9PROT|nr:ribbon-helix-helix domain-containing protein [Nitrosomonas aestuarii]SFL37018.1 hypothetical protein SAMN05216302_10705 [Nitrosomonas aestuarii]